jgi:amino acid transporter
MDDQRKGHNFGTAPVFLAAISTILGAIVFLRFGYLVANLGLGGAFLVILLGHAITIPTALAVSEIATNLKVRGGGEYYIISRSFGSMIGGTIGISLYAAQAISVSFYMIAFAQAFTPLFGFIQENIGIVPDIRMISIPSTMILLYTIYRRGANIGVNALWIIVSILGISLVSFLLGSPVDGVQHFNIFSTVDNPASFFLVFAIVFPAFTGLTAGVGLSGDLKNPAKSIPWGTVSATLVGMVVYFLVVFKLAVSASPADLAADQLIMSRIGLWGPLILIGLACATLSSAIGSLLIAPRTMQALAKDRIFPSKVLNHYLSKGTGEANEPSNATFVTAIIALLFVSIGTVDFVAQIISMFFMITYGSVCLVSFLQHFAGNLSYQPTFRTKWYLSLTGAVLCFFMMFQMSPFYATLSLIAIGGIYLNIKHKHSEELDLSDMVTGAFFQASRQLRVIIQHYQMDLSFSGWRPSFIGLSSTTFKRLALFDILRWFSHYYGFGTYIHYIPGDLSQETKRLSKKDLEELIQIGSASKSSIYADTIIASTFKTAVEHIVQMPGVSGMENNGLLVEYDPEDKDSLRNVIDASRLAAMMSYNMCILRPSEKRFGYRNRIHVWLTPEDYRNSKLMTTLAYILSENPDWKGSTIEIFAPFHKNHLENHLQKLTALIESDELPLSKEIIQEIQYDENETTFEAMVEENSALADILILSFSIPKLETDGQKLLNRFKEKDVLYVRAGQKITISEPKVE